MDQFSLLDLPQSTIGSASALELTKNETALALFTPSYKPMKQHYCDDPERPGYVRCNEDGCVMCRAGRVPETRYLLPVYSFNLKSVGVLSIPSSSHPGALLPQLMPLLRKGGITVCTIRKPDQRTFEVTVGRDLPDNFAGKDVIEAFVKRMAAKEINLTDAFPSLSNAELAEIPAIKTMLDLKGITIG